MDADRRVRLMREVVALAGGRPVAVEHVCAAVLPAVGVDGLAISVILAATPRETIYTTDQVAADLAELSITLGEGPCVDAAAGLPAFAADLSAAAATARWPIFAPEAVRAGAGAVFALPLQVGAIRFAVMALYRGTPGRLDNGQLADALVLADTACAVLLDATVPPGRWTEHPDMRHPEIHQATGMLIIQLGVPAAAALTRLRAHAYANDRRLRDVAADVVARRLRFEPDDPQLMDR